MAGTLGIPLSALHSTPQPLSFSTHRCVPCRATHCNIGRPFLDADKKVSALTRCTIDSVSALCRCELLVWDNVVRIKMKRRRLACGNCQSINSQNMCAYVCFGNQINTAVLAHHCSGVLHASHTHIHTHKALKNRLMPYTAHVR